MINVVKSGKSTSDIFVRLELNDKSKFVSEAMFESSNSVKLLWCSFSYLRAGNFENSS